MEPSIVSSSSMLFRIKNASVEITAASEALDGRVHEPLMLT
jgi:hypothetical protein